MADLSEGQFTNQGIWTTCTLIQFTPADADKRKLLLSFLWILWKHFKVWNCTAIIYELKTPIIAYVSELSSRTLDADILQILDWILLRLEFGQFG